MSGMGGLSFGKLLDPLNLFGLGNKTPDAPAAPAAPPAASSASVQDDITKRQRIAAAATNRATTLLTGGSTSAPGVSGDPNAGSRTLLGA